MTDAQWERIFARLLEDIFDRQSLRRHWSEISQDEIDYKFSPAWRAIIEQELAPPRPNATFTRVHYPDDTAAEGLPGIPVAFAQVTHETLIAAVNTLIEGMVQRNCTGWVLHCRATTSHLELEMRGELPAATQTPPPEAYLP